MRVELELSDFPEKGALSEEESAKFVYFANLFPHGAHAYDLMNRDNVSMSNNMARMLLVNGKAYVQTSLRFFDREEVRGLERELLALAQVFGFSAQSESEYPSWKPVADNPVLEKVKEVYRESFGSDPQVKAIHAG